MVPLTGETSLLLLGDILANYRAIMATSTHWAASEHNSARCLVPRSCGICFLVNCSSILKIHCYIHSLLLLWLHYRDQNTCRRQAADTQSLSPTDSPQPRLEQPYLSECYSAIVCLCLAYFCLVCQVKPKWPMWPKWQLFAEPALFICIHPCCLCYVMFI